MPAGRAVSVLVLVVLALPTARVSAAEPPPDYAAAVVPLLTKYCGGCHKADEPEGQFSVATYADLVKGGEHGPALLAGDSGSSRMMRLITGAAEPRMPPEEEKQPSAEEIAILKAWIDGGAKGPEGAEPEPRLVVPVIESRVKRRPVTAIAASPDGKWIAIGEFETVYLLQRSPSESLDDGPVLGDWKTVRSLREFPGKVQAVHFTGDSQKLVTASGITGLTGQAALWNVVDGALVREFRGHRDALYDAELSPDGQTLATCGYDRKTILWNAATGEPLRTLEGHNGAIYDVAFSPDGLVVATASADDTCKLWSVATGERLDTLGQPLKEVYCVTFSPDGRFVLAGGADNRIRVWQFLSKTNAVINPLVYARFGHEGAILQMAFTPNGKRLVTLADDRTLKLWETETYNEVRAYERQPAIAAAVATTGNEGLVVGRLDGTLAAYEISGEAVNRVEAAAPVAGAPMPAAEMTTVAETEPNDEPAQATAITVPATATGVVNTAAGIDADCFRFVAKAGQEWVIEVNAARSGSPLDSKIEVLDSQGKLVPRVMLQAVRDTYFTFRGKDGSQTDDFRLFNWEEMELNEFLFANGEVVKFWRYPRGPDSGFMVYPGEGSRYGYFDTTPLSHPLGEPCYIVEAHTPGTELIPNGLPTFVLNYENDDDARRELGADSKLLFTAPADGEYVVRLRDVRGQQGEKFSYSLVVRPRQPDFAVTLHGADPTISAGSAKEFRLTVKRSDGYEGPIRVDIDGLPPGVTATTPIVIQDGQLDAFGVLIAAADAPAPTPENSKTSKVTATAEIRGQSVTHDVNAFGEIKVGPKPKLLARIEPHSGGVQPVAAPADGPLEFEIEPGQTIMLNVKVDRDGYDGQVPFGNAESGRNLPHGLYVDNIGLNGLLILENMPEREFFITAAKWVPDQSRLFHLKTDVEGGQATRPVLLHIRRKAATAAK